MQRILDRQARAVLDGDATAYLAAVDPAATNYRAGQRRMFANLRRLPLRTWSYRVTAVHDGPTSRASTPSGGRAPARALAVVELSHQLRGYDQGVRVDRERLLLTARDGDWYLSGEDEGSARQLWKQGKVSVSRGKHSLVLGVGRPRRELEALVSEADRAVPAVSRLWPRPWNRRVVVLAPASLERTAELLSAAPAQYRGIAAVTTSERHGVAPADRVVVNPGAYGTLSGSGRQVVMTHETAHVATREDTTETTPMWLSEGLADWIGYGGSDREVRRAAPELAAAVRSGELSRALPTDAEFAFERPADLLARSYEAGWLACLMVVERGDAQRLRTLYRAAGRPGPGATDRALRDVLQVDEREFGALWHSYVRRVLG